MSTSETPPGGTIEPAQLVGTLFADRFRVLRQISEGANSTICDALDETTGRTVTLKLIRPRLAASPSFRTRFDEVMRSVAALTHPNIAAVYDWGIARLGDTSTAYVVIEQLTGGSLRDLFDRGRQLTPSQALAVGLEACRGLDHAHRRGFVHGELTPSKLVFGDDRRLRIVDFGLARLLGEAAWAQPDSVPTHVAWYASPEQGLSQEIDGKTDVYALCLALHEAVTGFLPFQDDSTVASLAARVGRLMPVSADLGPLAAVFERAGRPDADDRASASEFGQGLVQAAAKLPRPEPLPLLSTGLFETPVDELRSPDDPTGGVTRPRSDAIVVVPADHPEADQPAVGRPAADERAADEPASDEPPPPPAETGGDAADDARGTPSEDDAVPEPPVIVEAEPDADIPTVDPGEDLVILPLDSDIAPDVGTAVPGADRAASEPQHDTAELVPSVGPTAGAAATRVMPVTVPEHLPRRHRRFPWKILVGVLVVAALAVLGVLATRLFETPVYPVPDLVELPEAEARNVIATNGWVVTIERERSDLVPVVGQVVRTAPQAGVELAEGEPFLIVVSDGPTLRELPDSAGVAASEAQTRLLERGLTVESVEQFDEEVPDGTVISWSVPGDPTLAAGSMVEPETLVQLVVSNGPMPRVVPDVVGRPVGEARAAIEGLQLEFIEAEQQFSDEVPLGVVISQSIEPTTEVERGSGVSVVVSKGPDLVIFPDISAAASFEEAAAILREAGFEPRLAFGDTQGAIREYTIDGVVPEIGATYRRGTQVDFQAL